MRNIFKAFSLLSILFLLTEIGIAQDGYQAVRTKLNEVFSQIDKSQIPTGILHEYGYQLADLPNIDAQDTLDITAWNMCYTTLYYARIAGTQTLAPQESVNTMIDNFVPTANNTLQIPVLHYDYNTLRTDAVSAGLLQVSGEKLYDVPNRPSSPYQTQSIFVAALEKSHSNSGTVNFLFRSQLFFQNRQKTVQTLELHADNGQGWQTASFDIPLTINYPTSGDKLVKIRVTYTDGSSAMSQSTLYVQESSASFTWEPTDVVEVVIPATAEHSGGTLQIVYSDANSVQDSLRRPLLILEGFDQHHIASRLQKDNYDIRTFIDDITIPVYDLNFELDNEEDFDLVFLDYNDGVDDIRRNAKLFRDALLWINENKGLRNGIREDNVVLGMSMGGLVARYGLAEMEKEARNGLPDSDHDTRLLITHDSPHRGANIAPLGAQLLVRTLADNPLLYIASKNLIQAIAVYNRPATAQQAIYWVKRNSRWNYTYQFNTFLDNEYRTMITFPANAPTPYREIATSNGAACGERLFAPSSNIFDFSGSLLLGGSIRFELDADALPIQGEVKRIFSSRQYFKVNILNVILIDITIHEASYNSTPNMLPYDGAAGGTEKLDDVDTDLIIGSTIFGKLWRTLLFNPQINIHEPLFCFVPRTSALDLETVNESTLNSPYTQGFSPSNPSSFDDFYTEPPIVIDSIITLNQPHLEFTFPNAEYIFNEIIDTSDTINNPLNCNGPCLPVVSADIIDGSDLICSSETYSLNIELPPHVTFLDWTTSNNNLFINPATGRAVANTNSGASSIIARLETHCGDTIEVEKLVWVGVPNPISEPIRYSAHPICPDEEVTFTAKAPNPWQAQVSFHWTTSNGGSIHGQNDTNGTSKARITFDNGNGLNPSQNGWVSVLVSNDCGDSIGGETYFFNFGSCGNGDSGNGWGQGDLILTPATGYALYENPVLGDLMYMSIQGDDLEPTLENPYHFKIYDNLGQERISVVSDQVELSINVSELENGMYHSTLTIPIEGATEPVLFQRHFQIAR